MCNEVRFDINLKLTKFALKWVLTWRDSFIFKYCNHGKYVKFHLKMKRLHPRAGPSSRHMAISKSWFIKFIISFGMYLCFFSNQTMIFPWLPVVSSDGLLTPIMEASMRSPRRRTEGKVAWPDDPDSEDRLSRGVMGLVAGSMAVKSENTKTHCRVRDSYSIALKSCIIWYS